MLVNSERGIVFVQIPRWVSTSVGHPIVRIQKIAPKLLACENERCV